MTDTEKILHGFLFFLDGEGIALFHRLFELELDSDELEEVIAKFLDSESKDD
jgi:hypothetical protein